MTQVGKNMKSRPMTRADQMLLQARNMAETIIGHIKAFSSLNLPKHRSPVNTFIHLIAALTAYQLNPIQLNNPPALQLS
jgi:Transposase DDE domain